MQLLKFKILYCWISKPLNNKVKEVQINKYLHFYPMIDFKIDLQQFDTNILNFYIDLFGLVKVEISKSKNTDHAGFWFNVSIFGLDSTYRIYDTRHWDHDKETWEVYEDEELVITK